MATYKLLKLKNYIFHLTLGTFLVLFSLGIIQSIVSEMINEYKPSAGNAYFAGIFACLMILGYAIIMIYRSFNFEKILLKKLTADQKKMLYDELDNQIQMIVKGQAIMTTHFLIVPIRRFGPYKLLKKEDIIACFKTERHQESKAINGRLRIFTSDFKSIVVSIGGKGSSLVEQEMLSRMIKTMPWIKHDNYEDFLLKSKSRGMHQILVKEVKDDRAEYIASDPETYDKDEKMTPSDKTVPVINHTNNDPLTESEKKKRNEKNIELKSLAKENDSSLTNTFSQKLSSASSMIAQFIPKTKNTKNDQASVVDEMFEDIEKDRKEKIAKSNTKKAEIKKGSTHTQKKKHIDPSNETVLNDEQQAAILSFEELIKNSSKNRSSDKYKKS